MNSTANTNGIFDFLKSCKKLVYKSVFFGGILHLQLFKLEDLLHEIKETFYRLFPPANCTYTSNFKFKYSLPLDIPIIQDYHFRTSIECVP